MKIKYLPFLFLFLATNAFAECEVPPQGIADIDANGYYSDSHHSIVNRELQKKEKESVKPFEKFLKFVSKKSDDFIAKADTNSANCALIWLDRWAQDGAMLGKMNSTQAAYERKWTLAGLAISYIKIKPQASSQQQQHIEKWFSTLADNVLTFANLPKSTKNNHYYWSGLAIMATGVATKNDYYINEARKIYNIALSDIADDGSLPKEMTRAGKALHYHNFSIAPLVMMAELAKSKNENWYQLQDRRLDKLAKLVLNGIANPSWFVSKTNVTQEIPQDGTLGWIEFYSVENPEFANLIQPLMNGENFYNARLGGDLTVLAHKKFFDKLNHQ